MAKGTIWSIVIALVSIAHIATSKEVLQLQGVNFELALTSYNYLAVLFFDDSELGQTMEQRWSEAAAGIKELSLDGEMGKISSDDADMKELIEAYGIEVPTIRVFRRGIMGDYRGPMDSSTSVANYIVEDSKPSVKRITSQQQMQELVEGNMNTIVFSLFSAEDIDGDDEEEDASVSSSSGADSSSGAMEGYSIDAWGQYQAAADSLRGHASFFVVSAPEIMQSLGLSSRDLPAVYLIPSEGSGTGSGSDGEGMLKYNGEILEMNLSEWVLRNSAPGMDELTVATTAGELYATQFFSSRKLKFILFLSPGTVLTKNLFSNVKESEGDDDDEEENDSIGGHGSDILEKWGDIATTFRGKAIFSYMTHPVADVLDYFGIDLERDTPIIAAHQPMKDYKYKSPRNMQLQDPNALLEFVAGVVSGVVPKVLKSEALPVLTSAELKHPPPVRTLVGSNVLDVVNDGEKDVLLVAYAPWCAQCKKFMPTYEVLGRAVQGEPRIVIAKLNALANDIPASWGVKAFPTLLWFPAKDKPYKLAANPKPRPYWDAGHSLHELVGFVQREGSFNPKTLKVATSEQLGSLLADEELLREKYAIEEQHVKRNEGRDVYDWPVQDYLVGEVVFDGKRWHVVLVVLLALIALLAVLMAGMGSTSSSLVGGSNSSSNSGTVKVVKKKKS
mmetsp:Transcript_27075/g.45348  ORF Transcript_27075/g.45348 Transcript_27075/m.45348 type:complete len:673 (+) Transcript_27075:61-2079(+)